MKAKLQTMWPDEDSSLIFIKSQQTRNKGRGRKKIRVVKQIVKIKFTKKLRAIVLEYLLNAGYRMSNLPKTFGLAVQEVPWALIELYNIPARAARCWEIRKQDTDEPYQVGSIL